MGRSNGLLNNIIINRANFDRLSVIALKTRNIISGNITNSNNTPSYLFSLDILEASWDGFTLTFNKQNEKGDNNISLIRFTDRPYRFDKHIVGEEAVIYINQLFTENPEGFNSFTKDPPNGILVVNKENSNSLRGRQEAFEIKMRTVANEKISMILNLLENQNNIEPFTNQPISLFIDPTNTEPRICVTLYNPFIRNSKKFTYDIKHIGSIIINYGINSCKGNGLIYQSSSSFYEIIPFRYNEKKIYIKGRRFIRGKSPQTAAADAAAVVAVKRTLERREDVKDVVDTVDPVEDVLGFLELL